jgi:hypothetical protein
MDNSSANYFDTVNTAMQNNTPHSRWIKVQLAKVALKVIDPLTGTRKEIIVEGNPQTERERCIHNCWSPFETAYFERENQYLILNGAVIRYGEGIETPVSPNMISDEDLQAALTKKFFAVQALLNQFTSPVPVQRMLLLAEEMNKPVGTINAIKERLAALQAEEYSQP